MRKECICPEETNTTERMHLHGRDEHNSADAFSEEIQRMKIKKAELETVCGITSKLPLNSVGEVAFAGKSNVGKSSLINALMNRKSLARVSQKPGKTQTINFYHINEGVTEEEAEEKGFAPDCYLVDLPGYGYAGVPEAEKAKWGPMIERYLHRSQQLRAVFLLLDIRHEPTKNDVGMYEWIKTNGFAPFIIATKKDKIKRSQVAGCVKTIRKTLHIPADIPVTPFSSETKEGLEDVWKLMKEAVSTAENKNAPDAGEEPEAGDV